MAEISKPNVNKIWADTGSKVAPSDAKIAQGWTAEIPPFEYENFVQNKQDQFDAHVNQHGVPEWDSITEYRTNKSYAMGSDGLVYKCILTNTNKNPVSDPSKTTYWSLAFDPAGTSYNTTTSDSRYLRRSNNLSDLTDAAAARTNLQLGTSATQNTGTEPGEVMRIGDWGIGRAVGVAAQTLNIDTLKRTGFFYLNPSSTTLPYSDYWYLIHHTSDVGTHQKQTAWAANTNNVYTRTLINNVWTSWVRVLTQGAFGVGNIGDAGWVTVDLNTLRTTQFIPVSSASANIPFNGYFMIFVEAGGDTSWCKQTASAIGGTATYYRFYQSGTWSAWSRVWDQNAFNPASKQDNLGFTPIRQGAGADQTANTVSIGWSPYGQLKAQVDSSDLGFLWHGPYQPNSSLAGNGYQILPNGMTIQWGYNGWGRVTFPWTFWQLYSIVTSIAGGPMHEHGVTNWNTSGFDPITNGNASNFFWMAIGRI